MASASSPSTSVTFLREVEATGLRDADGQARAWVFDHFGDRLVGKHLVVRQA